MSAITALLANEAGSGRGHIANLKQVARGLGPGVTCVAGLARLEFAADLQPLCHRVTKAPALGYSTAAIKNRNLEGTASWADYLAAIGLARETVVRESLAWWRDQIIAQDASILVAEYAPLAMLAAQCLKAQGWQIEVISTGTGYSQPPAHLAEMPVLLPDHTRVIHPQSEVLALLNRVCAPEGLAPLPYLAALYKADLTIAQTLPFLDPYRAIRPPSDYQTPLMQTPPALHPGGDEIFIYFSTRELKDEQIIAAVCDLPQPRRGYFPSGTPETLARLAAAGVQVEPAPISLQNMVRQSRMILHSGQHGTVCMSAALGLPQVAIPMHLEQVFNARRAGQRGVLRLVEAPYRRKSMIMNLVTAVYQSDAMRTAATALAQDVRAQINHDPDAEMAARLAPMVARAKEFQL